MQRRSFYYLQQVTYQQLNSAFDDAENGLKNAVVDASTEGVAFALSVVQHSPLNLTVDVTGPGVAYDKNGLRVAVPSTQNVNCAVDYLSVSTAVAGGGNSKILSLFAVFKRNPQTPQTDGNGATVYFDQNESFELRVVQGAEAPSPSAPALLADGILLADITIAFGTTQITSGMINLTGRREDVYVASNGTVSVRRGRPQDVVSDLVTYLGQHFAGTANKHAAAAIDYAGGAAWPDGTTNPAATAEAQFDKFISDLSSTVSTTSGTAKIGADQITAGTVTLANGTARSQLLSLIQAANHNYAGGSAWPDTTTNPATNVEAQLDKFITDLSSTTSTTSGQAKIGADSLTAGTVTLASGTVRSQHLLLIQAANHNYAGGGNWANGVTNPATNVESQIDKMITDLTSTGSNDGASCIAAKATTGFSAGTVRSQLDEVLSATQTFTGAKTFDNITVSAGNTYKVSSGSITKVQSGLMYNTSTNVPRAATLTVAAGEGASQVLELPNGCVLDSVVFAVDPTNASPPAGNKVSAKVEKINLANGNVTTIAGPTTDPTTGASYGPYHTFTLSGIAETIDRTQFTYIATYTGESSTGANNVTVYPVGVTMTVDRIPRGAT